MADRRVITKIAYDTGELVEGAEKVKLTLKSVDEAGKKQQQTTSSLEREYRRLVGAIDPADKAQQKYARAVQVTNRLVEQGRLTQEQANETLKKAETFYSAQAASIRNIGDLFDKLGGKSAILAGKLAAIAVSFKAGWDMGEQLLGTLNDIAAGNFLDNLSRTLPVVSGEFTDAAQKGWGLKWAAEALYDVQNDAAEAANIFRANLVLLRRYGIDPTGISAEEAAKRVLKLRQALLGREQVRLDAEAILPNQQELLRRAEVIRTAWKRVENSTEEARLNIARKGAEIAKSLREAVDVSGKPAIVPSFLVGLEQIVEANEAAKKAEAERLREAKRLAREYEQAWERAHEEAIAAEAKATEEAKKLAQQRIKDLAEGMQAAHQMAAKRAQEAWQQALKNIEAGLAPLRRALEELNRIDQDLDFARRATSIQAPTAHLQAIELQYLEFLRNVGGGSIEAGEAAVTKLSEIFGIMVDDIKGRLGELADLEAIAQIRGSGRTAGQLRADELVELERLRAVAIEQAIRTGEDTLEIERDFAARRLELRRQAEEEQIALINAHMAAWGNLFNFLGQRLGGLFQDVSNAIGTVQQTQGLGSQIGGLFGAAGAGGMAGLVVGFAIAAYDYIESRAASRRARRYETAALVGRPEGYDWTQYFTAAEAAMRRTSAQIRETIEAFAEAIGGVFTAFEAIEIKVRRDGKYFRAYVGGILLGTFEDMESAVEAAILQAFQDPDTLLHGVSDLVRQGFNEAVTAGLQIVGLEEFQEFLVDLREIAEIRWDDASRQMQAMLRHYDELWDSLLEITEGSTAQAQGAMDLAMSELDAWRARIRDFTGEPESRAEMQERMLREGALIEAQMGMRIAELKLLEAELRMRKEALLGHARIVQGEGEVNRADLQGRGRYLEGRAKLAEVEIDIYAATLAAIDAALEAIALLLAELERLKEEFDPENFKLPRIGGGGRRQAREWLDDNAFRLAAERMGDVERQLAEMNRMYDEQAEGLKAGSEEMRRLNEQRREEAALIRQRGIEAGYAGLRAYEGTNPFAAERERADAVRKGFADLFDAGVIGQERYERAVGRVNRALERHLELLGQQESATLFGQLAGLLDSAGLGDSAEKAALIAEQQKANFALQLAEAQLRYATLVAEGVLIGKNKDLVEGVLNRLASIDIDDLFPPQDRAADRAAARAAARFEARARQEEEARKRMEEALRLRERYATAQEDPFARRLREIEADFNQIFEALGRGQENLDLFRAAIDSAFDELTKPVEDWLASLGLSEQSPLTQQQQLELAASQYDAILARINAGDTSAYGELPGAGQQLLDLAAAQYGTAGSAYQQLYDRVIAMGQQAVSLADAMATNFFDTGDVSAGTVTAINLSTSSIVDAVAAGNQSAQQSVRELATIKDLTAQQAYSINMMAVDIQALRSANQSMLTELSMLRNSRSG